MLVGALSIFCLYWCHNWRTLEAADTNSREWRLICLRPGRRWPNIKTVIKWLKEKLKTPLTRTGTTAAVAAVAALSGPNPSPLTVSWTSAVAAWVRLVLEAEHTEILRGFSQHSPVTVLCRHSYEMVKMLYKQYKHLSWTSPSLVFSSCLVTWSRESVLTTLSPSLDILSVQTLV